MAKINCNGDCLNCEHRINGETHPSECASMFGFIHTQQTLKEMREMHAEILNHHEILITTLQNISVNSTDAVVPELNEFECDSTLLGGTEVTV